MKVIIQMKPFPRNSAIGIILGPER